MPVKIPGIVYIGTGVAAGVALNDMWEINRWPGFNQIAFPVYTDPVEPRKDVNVGVDDLFQFGIGAGLLTVGIVARRYIGDNVSKFVTNFGLGITLGTIAAKIGEKYPINDAVLKGFRNPIQIIPHIPQSAT